MSRTHILVASAVIAIAAALMFALAAIQLTAAGATTPAADGSYDAVERARSLLLGSSTSDSSYDQAEAS